MTKLKFKTGKKFNTEWINRLRILSVLFFAFDRFFKNTNRFRISYFNSLRLFNSFMQYGKKVFLKDFVLDKRGLKT